MKYSLNGERCTSSSRLLVEASIYDEFTEKLAERVRYLKVGNPLDPATEIGPLIDANHCAKVQSYVDLAVAEGATKTSGGGKPAGLEAGHFITPTFRQRCIAFHAHCPRGNLWPISHCLQV